MLLVQGDLFRSPPRAKCADPPFFTMRLPEHTGEDVVYYTCSQCSVRLNQHQPFSTHLDKDNYHKDPEKCPRCKGHEGSYSCHLCYGGGWV